MLRRKLFLQSQMLEIHESGNGNGARERLGFSVCSPDTCLGIHVLFLTTTKRRGVLLFRKGKLGHLHVDGVKAAGKKRAVLYGFGWGSGHRQRKAFAFPWVHLINVSFSPFPSDWFFSSSFAPFPAEAFSPNREII